MKQEYKLTGLLVRSTAKIYLCGGIGEGAFRLELTVNEKNKRDKGRIDDNWGNADLFLNERDVASVPIRLVMLPTGRIGVFVSSSIIKAAVPAGKSGGLRKNLTPGTPVDDYYRAILSPNPVKV